MKIVYPKDREYKSVAVVGNDIGFAIRQALWDMDDEEEAQEDEDDEMENCIFCDSSDKHITGMYIASKWICRDCLERIYKTITGTMPGPDENIERRGADE